MRRTRTRRPRARSTTPPPQSHTTATETATLEAFCDAIERRDAEALGACYSEEVEYADALFIALQGSLVTARWAMVFRRVPGLAVSIQGARVDAGDAVVRWDMSFPQPRGGAIRHFMRSELRIEGGRVVRHEDFLEACVVYPDDGRAMPLQALETSQPEVTGVVHTALAEFIHGDEPVTLRPASLALAS